LERFFRVHLDQPPAQSRANIKIASGCLLKQLTEETELKVHEHYHPDRPPQAGRCHLKDSALGMLKSSEQKWCRLHMDLAIQTSKGHVLVVPPPPTKTALVIF